MEEEEDPYCCLPAGYEGRWGGPPSPLLFIRAMKGIHHCSSIRPCSPFMRRGEVPLAVTPPPPPQRGSYLYGIHLHNGN